MKFKEKPDTLKCNETIQQVIRCCLKGIYIFISHVLEIKTHYKLVYIF